MKRLFLILALLLPLLSCGQGWFWSHTATLPTILTDKWDYVGISTVYGFGNVLKDGASNVSERGFVYSIYEHPTLTSLDVSIKTDGSGEGEFVTFIDALSSNTKYYIRAYATNKMGTSYGFEYNFTTLSVSYNAPTVTTTAISNIQSTSATAGGNVTADGGASVTSRGVCYSITPAPTVDNSKTSDGTGTGSFTSSLTGLTQGATYYVRAYATNAQSLTGYGNERSFTTTSQAPSVSTTTVAQINTTYALFGGNITDDGSSEITNRGIVLDTQATPTIYNYYTKTGGLDAEYGSWTEYIYYLTPNTLYYYRAYAENANGVAYGSILSFTTGSAVALPTVTLSSITESYVTVGYFKLLTVFYGGEVTASGGANVTERGYVYSINDATPTIGESGVTKERDGGGLGVFSSGRYDFTPGVVYHFRAYATNSAGTAYSTILSYVICKAYSYNSILYLSAAITINNVYSEFWDSLSEAQQAVYDHRNPAGRTINMNSFAVLNYWNGIANNDLIYVYYGNGECHLLAPGYYFLDGSQHKIIQIDSDGKVNSIETIN